MRGDAVGAGRDRNQRGAHRIRIAARPRVAKGGDVIDIDSEAQWWRFGHNGLALELEKRLENTPAVMRGLDPRIHLLEKNGLPGA
jgi:hypothetical protein